MVDLDTSHPRAWLPIIREMRHDVTCVFDSGTIYPEGYAREFADELGVETVCDSLDDMVRRVDAAIIHSCNWDLHVERARPFVEAGVPVLIDKPMVGNVRDAKTFIAWEEAGKVITGGSSLRWCFETQEFLAQPIEERGRIHTAFAGCGVDAYNYGIHAFSNLFGLMGTGCERARWLGEGALDLYELEWPSARGVVAVGEMTWIPNYATVVTDRSVVQFQPDLTQIYRALLAHDLPILAGEAPAVPMRELLEPELAAIAGLTSKAQGGKPVALADLADDSATYDGGAFARAYREQRLSKYLESKRK
jgi:hypothetical protein